MIATRPATASRYIRYAGDPELGGKAAALASLARAALPIPPWFVLSPAAFDDSARDSAADAPGDAPRPGPGVVLELTDAVRRIAPNGELVAVRSSAGDEDGRAHSFAGQFESYLFVPPADVPARVRDVWQSAQSDRVAAYRREHALGDLHRAPAVLVQCMIDADVAGVAFSADPVSGRRGICVVAAAYGIGTSVVSGEQDADTWQVDRAGTIVARAIAIKRVAHRRGAAGHGVTDVPVAPADATRPALSDEQIRSVAELARAAARHFGVPQDIEWALQRDTLYLLQSRAITSLAALSDPDGALTLWDNSNITESYGGVTTPLTYSFARYVYEEVYRQFCRIVGVPDARIESNDDALRAMLGFVRGRVYYNLVSWYRILALLPGYAFNREFMEQMMGVKEGLPPEVAARLTPPTRAERWRDGIALLGSIARLLVENRRLRNSIPAFHARLDAALARDVRELSDMRPDELVAHYRELERQLLRRWDAPLVNDFFAMIFYGVLRKLAERWCGDEHGSLQNDLVSGEGAMVSAEPAQRMHTMAEIAARTPALVSLLCEAPVDAIVAALPAHPEMREQYDAYLERFGDRCLEELKLETATLRDDPTLLLRSVGQMARAGTREAHAPIDLRGAAEERVRQALSGNPIRRSVFWWVLRNARERVRERENLRFERTRVFGRVRRICVELGRRYASLGALDDPRDIFYLTVDEALGFTTGTTPTTDIRALARLRAEETQRWRESPPPADRFETRGVVPHAHAFTSSARALVPPPEQGDSRRGMGCYPGVVRGPVRVVRDPRSAVLLPGEILVAERTDPGWVMLFPSASGLLVERGSLLSHSAIVARELGLPAVVSIEGLTTWLSTGDVVELDGRTGVVRRLASGEESRAE